MAWALEWAFILIGETVIFCRWFTSVVWSPRLFVKKVKLRRTRAFVEDFWTRSVSELIEMYNLQKWCLQEQSKYGSLKGLALRLATTMKIHYLFYLLWPLQVSLVCFNKGCFFISELLFSFKFLLGSDKVSFQSHGEFEEYREVLEKVCMPGENPERLWVANEKSMKQAKNHFNENKAKGYNCDKLFEFIMPHLESDDDSRFVNQLERLPHLAKYFPALDENCMRITALSLLNVIVNLLPLHTDVDPLTNAIEVYRQSFDLMSFVDNSDPQHPTTIDMLKFIDIEADRVAPEVAHYKAFEIINELLKETEEQLNAQKLEIISKEEQSGGEEQNFEEQYCDSRDWSAIEGSYSRYRVCKLILSREFNSTNELMEYLYGFLADVIAYCLLKLPNMLVKRCREWAVKFEEEKIWDAMYIAGQVMGVMHQKCNVEPTWNSLEPCWNG
ncbi:hypothetical protein SUGI_0579600 [Cryptomeria japonica]|nr:hypothetical protein SUGI_0579600 [Cryptomeria japonica]